MTKQKIWRRALIIALVISALCGVAAADQAGDVTVPRFDVVSVKPCDPGADAGGPRGGGRASPDRLYVPCMPVRGLIVLAFFRGQSQRADTRLVSGPDWINSARYTVEAVAPGVPLTAAMRNSMTLDVFASFLDSILDRPVTNGTMLKGLFDVRLEFSAEGTVPPVDPAVLNADPPRAASIFTALQEQLGLRPSRPKRQRKSS